MAGEDRTKVDVRGYAAEREGRPERFTDTFAEMFRTVARGLPGGTALFENDEESWYNRPGGARERATTDAVTGVGNAIVGATLGGLAGGTGTAAYLVPKVGKYAAPAVKGATRAGRVLGAFGAPNTGGVDQGPLGGAPGAGGGYGHPENGRGAGDILGPRPDFNYSGPDPFTILAGVQGNAAQQLAELEERYAADVEGLKGLFQFAETPEEKAQIAFLLSDLEEQRAAGQTIIQEQYAQAVEQAQVYGEGIREQAVQDGLGFEQIYMDAVARGESDLAASKQGARDRNVGLGTAQGYAGQATGDLGLLAAAAPRERALAQQLGTIAAEDVEFLGQSMAGEGAAQVGDLQRLVTGLRADAINRHNESVGNRIAGERAQYRDAALGLQGQYRNREFSLEDQDNQLAIELARIAESRRAGEQQNVWSNQRFWDELDVGLQLEGGGSTGPSPQAADVAGQIRAGAVPGLGEPEAQALLAASIAFGGGSPQQQFQEWVLWFEENPNAQALYAAGITPAVLAGVGY